MTQSALLLDVESLRLMVRTKHVLYAAGVRTVQDVLERTERELGLRPNFGRKSMDDLLHKLMLAGFRINNGSRSPSHPLRTWIIPPRSTAEPSDGDAIPPPASAKPPVHIAPPVLLSSNCLDYPPSASYLPEAEFNADGTLEVTHRITGLSLASFLRERGDVVFCVEAASYYHAARRTFVAPEGRSLEFTQHVTLPDAEWPKPVWVRPLAVVSRPLEPFALDPLRHGVDEVWSGVTVTLRHGDIVALGDFMGDSNLLRSIVSIVADDAMPQDAYDCDGFTTDRGGSLMVRMHSATRGRMLGQPPDAQRNILVGVMASAMQMAHDASATDPDLLQAGNLRELNALLKDHGEAQIGADGFKALRAATRAWPLLLESASGADEDD